jgi:hypothetical protein
LANRRAPTRGREEGRGRASLTDAGGAAGDEGRHAGLQLHLAGAGRRERATSLRRGVATGEGERERGAGRVGRGWPAGLPLPDAELPR